MSEGEGEEGSSACLVEEGARLEYPLMVCVISDVIVR